LKRAPVWELFSMVRERGLWLRHHRQLALAPTNHHFLS
jgi:hypothetical protein